jgi:glycosyltransferase involved in cell wall biosynthesis
VLDNLWLVRHVLPLVGPSSMVVENLFFHSRTILLNHALGARQRGPLIGLFHHSSDHDYHSRLYGAIDRRLARGALRSLDRVVTVSESSKTALLAMGVRPDRIHVIPNGTDAPRRERTPRDDGWVHALFVGACIPRKGVEFLIRALALLGECRIKLDVVGDLEADPRYARKITQMTRSFALEDRVTFHGWVPRNALWGHYARADVFILPSLWEGYGAVLLEAISFGLPIIATRAGGIGEIVEEGRSVLVAPPGDARALAAVVGRVCRDPDLRAALGEGSRSRQESLRSVAAMQSQFVLLAEQLAERSEE